MAFAGTYPCHIQQRMSVQLQVDFEHPAVVEFMKYITEIHPSTRSCTKEEATEIPFPDCTELDELAASKYDRMAKTGRASLAQLESVKFFDEYLAKVESNQDSKPTLDFIYSEPADHKSVVEFLDVTVKSEILSLKKEGPALQRAQQMQEEATKERIVFADQVQAELSASTDSADAGKGEEESYETPMFGSEEETELEEHLHDSSKGVLPPPPVFSSLNLSDEEGNKCLIKEYLPERLYAMSHLLTEHDCQEIIDMLQFSEIELKSQQKLLTQRIPLVVNRTSLRRKFVDLTLARRVYSFVSQFLPQQLEDGRLFAGVRSKMNFFRYSPGQFFKTHVDGGHRFRETGETAEYTFVIYLNSDFEGGSTRFCPVPEWKNDLTGALKPRQLLPSPGSCIVFRQRDMKHCGASLLSGCKYIIQGMVMYGPSGVNRLGAPVGVRPNAFRLTTCDC